MKDINYPGLKGFSREKGYHPPPYSNKAFEELLTLPPLLGRNKDGFSKVLGDLQANILLHHERDYSCCLFFSILEDKETAAKNTNVKQALNWIQKMSSNLTSAEKQFADKRNAKKNQAEGKNSVETNPICCFYITRAGYSKLGLEPFSPEDPGNAFEEGLEERLAFLFDESQKTEIWPKISDIHFMLLLASNDPEFSNISPDMELGNIIKTLDPRPKFLNWAEIRVQKGYLKRETFQFEKGPKSVVVEWFGYKDGISQPVFFPDLMGNKQFREEDVSPLRVVLVKDKGGSTHYSAGSFLAFLKIEQDVQAFRAMERTIAAHISLSEIQYRVSQQPISNLTNSAELLKAIRIDNKGKNTLASMAEILFSGQISDQAKNAVLENKIAQLILGNEIENLLSIDGEKRQALVDETANYKDEKSGVTIPDLLEGYVNAFEAFQNQAEIEFLKNKVAKTITEEILAGASADEHQQAVLHTMVLKAFSIQDMQQIKPDTNKQGKFKFLDEEKLKEIVDRNLGLAEAYIMGRFRNGNSATLCSKSETNVDRHLENDFSYHKIQAVGGVAGSSDEMGLKCPFSAHVRKANPRDGAQMRLLARRGIVYDDREKKANGVAATDTKNAAPPTKDVGLLFMSFQSNLVEQFEYILDHWLNTGSQSTGVDMLAATERNRRLSQCYLPINWGADDPKQRFSLPSSRIKPCIDYKVGAYFFAPSISFIKRIRKVSSISLEADTILSNVDSRGSMQRGRPHASSGFKVPPVKIFRGHNPEEHGGDKSDPG